MTSNIENSQSSQPAQTFTKEEKEALYKSIYTHDTVYIPPFEAGSAALEVALGCSWHRCTFCDFAKDKFCIHPLEKIEENIKVLALLQPDNDRLFLLGENAFVMSPEQLHKILDLRDQYLPKAKQVSMYSRIDNILSKTPEELIELRNRGLYALHIGIESGSDSILLARDKGITVAQIRKGTAMLEQAGIGYHITIIPGLGGRKFSRMHALETASLLSKLRPISVWCLKLKLWEDTILYKEYQKGQFDMMTPMEILFEERLMIENLNMHNCFFTDTTVLDSYTIQGVLPQQKQDLLNAIDYIIAAYSK